MKKLIGTAMLAALLATSAFAELSVGVWLRQLWSPVAYNGDDVMTGIQNSWGNSRTASLGLNWVGDDEKAGATLSIIGSAWWTGLKLDDDGDLVGDLPIILDGNNLIWVKPWDFLKFSLGHWDGINDISSINTASWGWIRPNNWLESNLYCENEATGAMVEVTPIDDLMIRVGLPFENSDMSYHMFEALTADVEYTIPDIVKVIVGWRGGRYNDYHRGNFAISNFKNDDNDFMNVGEVDVYASLLAVENLQLEAGARINILNSDYYKVLDEPDGDTYDKVEGVFRSSALIGLKAGYNITDNFSVKADFAVVTYKKYGTGVTIEHKPDFQFGVGVGLGLTDSLSLDADFRGLIKGDVKGGDEKRSADPTFAFLVGLNYVCSTNATVGIGFQGKTNGGGFGPLNANSDNFGFAVPIKVEVSF